MLWTRRERWPRTRGRLCAMAASGHATLAGHKPSRRLAARRLATPGRRYADWPRWPTAGHHVGGPHRATATPTGRVRARAEAAPALEPRSGHREKRGGEEGGGGEGRAHHGDGDGSSGFEGRGGDSVRLRAMWTREGALGDMGVRHEGRLGKTVLPSGPHWRWRRRLGRSRARFCGGGGPRALGVGAAR